MILSREWSILTSVETAANLKRHMPGTGFPISFPDTVAALFEQVHRWLEVGADHVEVDATLVSHCFGQCILVLMADCCAHSQVRHP
jgi:hypothetical protein